MTYVKEDVAVLRVSCDSVQVSKARTSQSKSQSKPKDQGLKGHSKSTKERDGRTNNYGTLRFIFNGHFLRPRQTPAELMMEDDDIIEAVRTG
ncbi:hypothetical protein Bca52824_031826 [Brassica carinata]|uniref:Rad60/SUMO-like domain-containing protein n=1 Tax=Brassica carinata TaxID=52824 RepID=A0A8X7SCY1_BRACI|nr:hypothetical protein Bca52824_031826 [Brassica carinata]